MILYGADGSAYTLAELLLSRERKCRQGAKQQVVGRLGHAIGADHDVHIRVVSPHRFVGTDNTERTGSVVDPFEPHPTSAAWIFLPSVERDGENFTKNFRDPIVDRIEK